MLDGKHLVVVGLATLLLPVLVPACSSDSKANPRVTFESSISPAGHSAADCPETGVWLKIGSFGNPAAGNGPDGKPLDPVHPVDNGGEDQQGTATVTCSVTPEGDGFHVAATAELSGATGGAFRIEGHMTAQGNQTNLDMSISAQGRTYNQKDCTATYDQQLQTTAGGRVWADFNCPNVENTALQRTCGITGQFRFENCGQ